MIETTPERISIELAHGKTMTNVDAHTAINGTYFGGNAFDPNSVWQIAVQNGKPIGGNSHTNSYKGHKRGTMVYLKDGSLYLLYANNIGDVIGEVIWAIGGNALYPAYDLDFENVMNDIRRNTQHTGLVYLKSGKILLLITKSNRYLEHFRSDILNTFSGVVSALNLDGGGSTSMKYNGKAIKDQGRKLSNIITVK